MFRPGETVCVSHNKFGYHSIPLENAYLDKVKLVPTDPDRAHELVPSEHLTLVALNPIKGWRNDESCTAFRSFLVEMDDGPLEQQIAYIKQIGLPYSAAIFSGGKSVHFLITLDQDLPSEKVWREWSEWILNIATMADSKTKNPSRSIRIPGGLRENGKYQKLLEFHGSVKLKSLAGWLLKHPDDKPKPPKKREYDGNTSAADKVKPWVLRKLEKGIVKDRNQTWYGIAYDLALSGVSEDDTIEFLGRWFVPESSFKEKEWLTAIKSAFKRALKD